jgi:hypothetical protein
MTEIFEHVLKEMRAGAGPARFAAGSFRPKAEVRYETLQFYLRSLEDLI